MATPASRPTYGAWLDQIATQGRTDEYGLVASAWAAAKASGRPKLFAVKSVNAWLSEHPPPGVANLQAALHALERAYHDAGGLPEQVAPPGAAPMAYAPSGPGGNPMAPVFQPPDPAMGQQRLGFPQAPEYPPDQPVQDPAWLPAEYQQPAPPAGQPWQQQPPAEPQIVAPLTPGNPNVAAAFGQPPENPQQVIMLMIGRLESMIAALYRGMEPLMRLAEQAEAADQALDGSQLAQPSEAQQRAMAIAEQQGWTPGPAFADPATEAAAAEEDAWAHQEPPLPDFYGGHAVPPNFAAMADASDGTEDAQ